MVLLMLLMTLFGAFLAEQSLLSNSDLLKFNQQNASTTGTQQFTRKSKFLPMVQFVSFENSACFSKSGFVGTCYSRSECDEHLGEAAGDCANGYGVCCVVTATCNSVISVNNTYFQNTNYPSGYSTSGICSVDLLIPAGTVQLKLEFITFNILGPVDGDCGNDTFVVSGVNRGETIPVLCGENSGQHVFLGVESRRDVILSFSTTNISFDRRWNIKVSFLSDYDPCKAPPRCLQYFTDVMGEITSFNYGGQQKMLLNDQAYAICFGYHADLCNIGFTFSEFDVGDVDLTGCPDDYLAIAGQRICGTRTGLQVQGNATGPIIVSVNSDEDNSNEEEGFKATYTYLPCTN